MKSKFSKAWLSSSQTRKQRKYRTNAPKHLVRKMMSASLSKDLRKKYGKRSVPIRKGDEVKVMAGKMKGKSGKVEAIIRLKRKVSVEGLQNKKKDGTKVNVLFDASNLQVQKLYGDDKKRNKMLERKAPAKKVEEKKEKPKSEPKKDVSEKKESK